MLKIFKYKEELEFLKKDYKRSEATVSLLKDRILEQEEENKELARQCNDLKAELKDMTLHLASLGLINGCLMEVVTEEQKKAVSKKIKIKETKKGKKNVKKEK